MLQQQQQEQQQQFLRSIYIPAVVTHLNVIVRCDDQNMHVIPALNATCLTVVRSDGVYQVSQSLSC